MSKSLLFIITTGVILIPIVIVEAYRYYHHPEKHQLLSAIVQIGIAVLLIVNLWIAIHNP